MSHSLVFKLHSGDTCQRFTLHYSSSADLFESLGKTLEERNVAASSLQWIDEEGDHIQLANTNDLQEALSTSPTILHLHASIPAVEPPQQQQEPRVVVIDSSSSSSSSEDEAVDRREQKKLKKAMKKCCRKDRQRSRSHSRGRKDRSRSRSPRHGSRRRQERRLHAFAMPPGMPPPFGPSHHHHHHHREFDEPTHPFGARFGGFPDNRQFFSGRRDRVGFEGRGGVFGGRGRCCGGRGGFGGPFE